MLCRPPRPCKRRNVLGFPRALCRGTSPARSACAAPSPQARPSSRRHSPCPRRTYPRHSRSAAAASDRIARARLLASATVRPAQATSSQPGHPPRVTKTRAAEGRPALDLREVVRVLAHVLPAIRRVAAQHLDRRRPVVEEALPALSRRAIADQRIEVGAGPLAAIGHTQVPEQRVPRDPEAAAGHRRGAAQVLRFLHYKGSQAQLAGCHGGQQASTGADDNDIEGQWRIFFTHRTRSFRR